MSSVLWRDFSFLNSICIHRNKNSGMPSLFPPKTQKLVLNESLCTWLDTLRSITISWQKSESNRAHFTSRLIYKKGSAPSKKGIHSHKEVQLIQSYGLVAKECRFSPWRSWGLHCHARPLLMWRHAEVYTSFRWGADPTLQRYFIHKIFKERKTTKGN